MAYDRGSVVLVPFPFSDLSTAKVRPAVVVSGDLYHSNEPDQILAAITSNITAATGPHDYVLGDWQAAGLRYPSAFKPVLFTLDPSRVIYQVGVMASSDLSEVDDRLRSMLGL